MKHKWILEDTGGYIGCKKCLYCNKMIYFHKKRPYEWDKL